MTAITERHPNAQNHLTTPRREMHPDLQREAGNINQTMHSVHVFFRDKLRLYQQSQQKVGTFNVSWDVKNCTWTCAFFNGKKQCSWTMNPGQIVETVTYQTIREILASLKVLNNTGESGALNLSFIDVLAVAHKQWATTRPHNWEILKSDLSMCPKPLLTTHDPHSLENDFGYIHDNCAIPNHAFYTAIQLISHRFPRMLNLNEIIIEIWIRAFLKTSVSESFLDFAKKTLKEASDYSPVINEIVKDSWNHVQVQVE
jgi:hypothetical protein